MPNPPTYEHDDENDQDDDRHGIKVTVRFSMSDKPDFHDRVDGSATVGTIRKAAMVHFATDEDPNHTYYLTHERQRQNDDVTVGDLVDEARSIKFRLVKELTQG